MTALDFDLPTVAIVIGLSWLAAILLFIQAATGAPDDEDMDLYPTDKPISGMDPYDFWGRMAEEEEEEQRRVDDHRDGVW